jgi:valyl-tRNA synthetase
VSADLDMRIIYEATVDRGAEIARIKKEVERLEKDVESKKKRLADDSFRSKAPAEIVRNLETTLGERQGERQKLLDRLKQLE